MTQNLLKKLPSNLQPKQVKTDINFAVVTFTPEQAQYILEHLNPANNRKLSRQVTDGFIASMEAKCWLLNGEPIIFDKEGNLLDGQHRLTACVASNLPLTTVVVTNIDHKVFATINTGKARNAADAFKIAGVPNSQTASQIVGKVLALRKGYAPFTAEGNQNTTHKGGCRNQISLDEYNANQERYSTLTSYILSYQRKMRQIDDRIITATALTVADLASIIYYLSVDAGHDIEVAKSFVEELIDSSKASNLMRTLRAYLVNDHAAVTHMSPAQVKGCLAKGWEMYVTGKRKKAFTIELTELVAAGKKPAVFISASDIKKKVA